MTATAVSLPVSAMTDWEPREGMLVTFPQSLTIGEYFNFDRFNEIVLTVGRQFQPTAVDEPGSAEAAALAAGQPARPDHARRRPQRPEPGSRAPPGRRRFDLDEPFRGGDMLQNVTGVMDYAFGLYRIQPTEGATTRRRTRARRSPRRRRQPDRVASFNVLNYFTTLQHAAAPTPPEEFVRQRTRSSPRSPSSTPTSSACSRSRTTRRRSRICVDRAQRGRAARAPTTTSTPASIGTDAIKVAFIYKPARVTPVGDHAILDSSVDPRFIDTRNRPALAQTFQSNDTRRRLHRGRQPPQVEGLRLQRRRRPGHRRRLGQLQPHAHGGRRGAGRLAGHRPDGQRRRRLPHHRRPQLLRQGGPDRRAAWPVATPTCAQVPGRARLLLRVRRPDRLPRPRARRRAAGRRGHRRDGLAHQRRRARPSSTTT